MGARTTVAQTTGSLPISELPKVLTLTKPQTDQAITLHLDGATKLDLTAIANDSVTFVRVGDRLIILFDNHSTVTIEPFYNSMGLPLADISVELSPDRTVSGAEFASLFPITTDPSILPAAGDGGSPPSGGHFEMVTIDQFANNQTPLSLLTPDAPGGGNPIPGNPPGGLAPTAAVADLTLGVHDAAGSEDRPIALGITDALSSVDPHASLGNVTITGVPAGATLSAGIHNADGSWTLTPAQLAGLTLVSDGEVQHFTLTVDASATDGAITTSSTATFNVSVTPVADTPTLVLGNGGGNPFVDSGPLNHALVLQPGGPGLFALAFGLEDKPIALPISAALGEVDPDAVLSVTISGIPAGVTLSAGSHNADGSVTLTPAQLAGLTLTGDGEASGFDLKVTATVVDGGDIATSASLSGTFLVFVESVSEKPGLASSDATAASSSVNEDSTVALTINPHFEQDADATNTVTISGLGTATLNHGTVNPDGSVTLQQSDLNGLTLTAGDDDTATIKLVVQAHTSDNGAPTADSDIQTISLTVNPAAETPVLTASTANNVTNVDENGTVALNITVGAEADNDATTTVTISGLGTATLNHPGTVNPDGSVTLQQSDLNGLTLSVGDHESPIKLTITASTNDNGSIATSSAQTIDLAVNPVAETPAFTSAAVGSTTEDHSTPLTLVLATNVFEDANDSVAVSIALDNGATLLNNGSLVKTDAQGHFVLNAASNDDLAHLTVVPASEFEGDIHVNITAVGQDGAASSSTAVVPELTFNVSPLAEAPTLVASAASSTVNEDGTVALTITPTPAEPDDTDAVTTVTVSDLGTATLNHGTLNKDGSVTLQQSDLSGLTLTAAHDETSTISLQVQAHTSEGGTQADSAVQTIELAVQPGLPVLNAGDATAQSSTVNEGATVALDINPQFDIADADATDTVTISGLAGAILSAGSTNSDGSVTLTAGQLVGLTLTAPDVDSQTISLAVQAHASEDGNTADSSTQTISLTVGPAADQPVVSVSANATPEDSPTPLTITLDKPANLFEDADDSVVMSVTLSNGATLLDNGVAVTPDKNGDFSITAHSLDDLAHLSVLPASEFEGTINVTVKTQAHDGTATTAGVDATTTFSVTPNAEAPAVVASAATSSVDEGGTVALSIQVTPEIDSDATTTITVSNLGTATLNHGTVHQDGSVTLQQSDLSGLTLTAADDDTSNIHLVVTASTSEVGTTATTQQTIDLTVNPVAEKPTLTVSVADGSFDNNGNLLLNQGGTAALTITPQFEADADATDKITITGLNGATLNHGTLNSDGSVTLTPDQLAGLILTSPTAPGTISLHVTASAAEGNSTATSDPVTLNVNTVPLALHGVELTQTDDDAVVFNLIPVSTGGTTATLLSVTIGGIPIDISAEQTPFVFTDSNGNHIPLDGSVGLRTGGFSAGNEFPDGSITFNFDPTKGPVVSQSILDGIQLNFDDSKPMPLTLTTVSVDSSGQVQSSVSNSFTLNSTPIADAPVLVTHDVTGTATVPIPLSVAAVTEVDPDETVTIVLSGVPKGASLNHGTITATDAVTGFTTWTITNPADLTTLTLTSDGVTQHFNLKVDATAAEGTTSASATEATLHVDVAVASETTPVLSATAAAASVNEDGTVALDLNVAPGDATIKVSGLKDANGNVIATLVHLNTDGSTSPAGTLNSDGTVTLHQSDLHNLASPLTLHAADGDTAAIDLTLTATTPTSVTPGTASIHLAVNPVPDTPTVIASGPTAIVDTNGHTIVTTNEGGTVALTITPTFEVDPDSTGTVTISGLAGTGATLVHLNSDGSTSPVGTASTDGNSVTLQLSDLNGLAVHAPTNTFESFTLQATANTSEGGTTAVSNVANLTVDVVPLMLQLQQLPGDEAAFNIVPVTIGSNAALQSVTIGGIPIDISTDATPYVFTDSHGNHLALGEGVGLRTGGITSQINESFTGTITFTHDQLFNPDGSSTGILNGIQLNLGENSPLNLTLTAVSTDGSTTETSGTLLTVPTPDAPVLTEQAVAVTAGVTTLLPVTLTTESDPDQTVKITVPSVPADVTLSVATHNGDGSITFTALTPNSDGSFTLTPAQVNALALTSNATASEDFNLTISATATEGGITTSPTTVTLPVHVNFDAQATIDSATAAFASINEGGSDALDIVAGPFNATVNISNLGTATLNHGTFNPDGSVTLTESQLNGLTLTAADDDTSNIHLTVVATSPTDGSTDAKTIDIAVNPVAEKPTLIVSAPNDFSDPSTHVPTVSVNENGSVALNITPKFENDPDAVNTVTITGLAGTGAILDHGTVNPDGSVTLQQADLIGLTLTAPDTPQVSGVSEVIQLQVTANSQEGTSSATSTTAPLNVDVAPIVAQGVQIHTDDTDRFKIVTVQSDSDATLQSLTIQGLPENIETDSTNFQLLDSNGVSIPFNGITFPLSPAGGGVDFDIASATLTPAQIQSAITNGLQLVAFDRNGNSISLEGQILNLTLVATAEEGNVFSSSSTPFTLGIAETPTLSTPSVTGAQGTPIALTVNASANEPNNVSDPDTVLSLTISGLPTGVSLSDQAGDPLLISSGSIKLTAAELVGLSLISDGEDQHFNLAVTATAVDGGNAATAATSTSTLHVDVTPATSTTSVAAQFDSVHNVLNFSNHTIETNTSDQTVQLTDGSHPAATLSASGDHLMADGANETLDMSLWDRAVEIDFAAGTIRLDASSPTLSGSLSAFADVLGTTHNDWFDNLTGGVTVTGGAGAVDHFGLAANVLNSANVPTITNLHSNEAIDLSALLDAKFGPGSDATKAANFVQVKEDVGGNSATLSINVGGAAGGTFVAAAHLNGVHSGDIITAILDHAHTMAQIHAA
jgi:hypothetical protein